MSFNKGDKIKLVNIIDCNYNITLGKVYEATDSTDNGNCVYILDDDGDRVGPFAYRFELVPSVNGVDKDGNAILFTRADLKSLQRVVLADGTEGIIAEEGFGTTYGVCVVYDTAGKPYGSFDPAYIEDSHYPRVVEVYENPGFGNMYKQGVKGDLIWKRRDVAAIAAADAEVTKAKLAIAEATAEMQAAQAALAVAEATRAAL